MNLNEEHDFNPGLKLLPFGGFDVASLLLKLHNGNPCSSDSPEDALDFQPLTDVSSGWLRSKMMIS